MIFGAGMQSANTSGSAGVVRSMTDIRRDRMAAQMQRPIREQIEDYVRACETRRLSAKNIWSKRKHLAEFAAFAEDRFGVGAGIDLHREQLEAFLSQCQAGGLSARSCNHRRQNVAAWAAWMVKQDRIDRHPFAGVEQLSEARDRRHQRRALSKGEIHRLAAAALDADPSGHRCTFYLLAALAGFRRGDCERLRWRHVDLEAGYFTIDFGKADRVDEVSIRPELRRTLELIRPQPCDPRQTVLASVPNTRTVHRDFERAGIPRRDERGRVADVHALRTTLGTQLALDGVPMAHTQRIMRHADYRTTMKFYQVLEREQTRERLDAVDFGLGEAFEARVERAEDAKQSAYNPLRTLTVFPDNARANGEQHPNGRENGRSGSGGGRRAGGPGGSSGRGRRAEGGADDRKG